MNETVKEWIRKSDGDFRVADRELHEAKEPNYDAICFHCQQCIEKLMKAVLINQGEIPLKIHDLSTLSRSIKGIHKSWNWLEEDLRFLSLCSIYFRYPGEEAQVEDAQKAFDICTRLRTALFLEIPRFFFVFLNFYCFF
jgi:HEPN domain-containing protein